MAEMDDTLERFVKAQATGHEGGTYAEAVAELGAGAKRGHWMWYVFPQLRGLGSSRRSAYFGIADLDEARAYLAHPVLGPRLFACARLVLAIPESSAEEVLGPIDSLKLHACATLFDLADPDEPCFAELRSRFFAWHQHPETVALLEPGQYVFTEAALAAAMSTPLWTKWPVMTQDPAMIQRYFLRMVGMTAETEDEMALMELGGNNMGGGVPIEILRLLARLSRVRPLSTRFNGDRLS